MFRKALYTIGWLLAVQFFLINGQSLYANNYLRGKISRHNLRFKSFSYSLSEMSRREFKTIVETGTARCGLANCEGDGCSTCIFAEWACDHNAQVYSVDIDATFLETAADALTDQQKGHVEFVHSDSVEFLKNFSEKIDFLYLDSYDFSEEFWRESQEHCLNEVKAAYPHLHERSIIMIDDCNIQNGGKGGLAIPYLVSLGWKVKVDQHQVVLIKSPLQILEN